MADPHDQGPWGRRDGRDDARVIAPVQMAEPKPSGRRYGGPSNTPPPRRRGQVTLIVSTLLMVGFLWLLTGSWIVAGSLMFALFVHEYGHVLAMNRLGMGPARIYVIPFLGGLAKGQTAPRTEWIGVLVSLAGPAFGLLAMLPLLAVWAVTGNVEWIAAAFFVAMLNLINLVPAPPLDGSRALGPVLAKVHPMLEKLVLLAIGVAVVWWGITTGRYILAVFLGLAIWGHLSKGGLRATDGPLTGGEAVKSLGLFLGTGVLCGGAALGALLAMTGGDVARATDMVGRYLGIAL